LDNYAEWDFLPGSGMRIGLAHDHHEWGANHLHSPSKRSVCKHHLTATTVDGTPPASSSATVTVGTHSFVLTKASMETGREAHTAALLDFGPALTNGKVLVTGGVSNNNQALASAEVFDPSSGTFMPTKSSMATARAYHTATLLNDGRILVTGGFDQFADFNGSVSGDFLASAEIFDPTSETFTPTKGSMATARAYHT
jgi:hypothetical protein